jgi:hypothetical protein
VLDERLRVRDRGRGGMAEPVATWCGKGWPTHGVGLRTGGGRAYRITTEQDELSGTVDGGRAFSAVHPGAVYLHQGSRSGRSRSWRTRRAW